MSKSFLGGSMKKMVFSLAAVIVGTSVLASSLNAPKILWQQETPNPSEFRLTSFTDASKGISFHRPSSWTLDSSFKTGVRFVGGDEWLELSIARDNTTPQDFSNAFKVPNTETKLKIRSFKQGTFSAFVISSKSVGSSSVTGKPLDLLTDRWVFTPQVGRLALLAVTGPKKVFDWEGNRDMALSVRVK
jgi:hypothetical protein